NGSKIVGSPEAPRGFYIPYGDWIPVDVASRPDVAEMAEKAWPNREVAPNVRFMPIDKVVVPDESADPTKPKKTEEHVTKEDDQGREFILAAWLSEDVQVDNTRNVVREDED